MRDVRRLYRECSERLIRSFLTAHRVQMDMGVGSFVFSQGVVSAIPLIKDPHYLNAPILPKIVTTTRKCIPVLVLGLLRTLSVKGTDYPVCKHWTRNMGVL